jgi:site-specific DNA-methyltransferase (adenine-specific)
VYKTKLNGVLHNNLDGSRLPSTVVYCKSEWGHHSTVKPVKLLQYLTKMYSDSGQSVIDPFMGSGTTGVAAIMTGRKFIGIEKDKAIFETAVERITKAYNTHSPNLFRKIE